MKRGAMAPSLMHNTSARPASSTHLKAYQIFRRPGKGLECLLLAHRVDSWPVRDMTAAAGHAAAIGGTADMPQATKPPIRKMETY